MPNLEIRNEAAHQVASDVVAVAIYKGPELTPAAKQVDDALGGMLTSFLTQAGFKGDAGEIALLPTLGRLPSGAVLATGVGEKEKVSSEEIRRAAGNIARRASNYPTVASALHNGVPGDGGFRAEIEGLMLGSYQFLRYKSDGKAHSTEKFLVIADTSAQQALLTAMAVAKEVAWARDLINEPAGTSTPARFSEVAAKHLVSCGVEVEVHEESALEQMKMGGLLGVGKGSDSPPRFFVARYEPAGADQFVALVGKGVTFDTGGLSLKNADSMEQMKTDMSGGAAVLATASVLGALKPNIKVLFAVPMVENMPSGHAIRPGDVIHHYGGKTSEVLNTDAEGRIVLGDALAWVAEAKPQAVADLATLTGGIMVALGKKSTGLFSNDDAVAEEILSAASKAGERMWRMPIYDDYLKDMDSQVADFTNTGSRWGSAIFGALYLKQFVGDRPWAHLDIAGTSWADAEDGHLTKGATGVGVSTMVNWILDRATTR